MAARQRLEGKVAIVTGASTGIGRAIALKLADEGARLVVCASRRPKHEGEEDATHDLICGKHGDGRAVFQKTDASVGADLEACVNLAVDKCGRLDVLINNAGVLHVNRCHETTEESFDELFGLNVRGVFLGCKAAVTQFLKQEPNAAGIRGNIVNIGSFLSHVAAPLCFSYGTSKGALAQMTRVCTLNPWPSINTASDAYNGTQSIAVDYAADGILCNMVCPGYARTEMLEDVFKVDWIVERMKTFTPMWDVATPGACVEGTANTVAFMASDECRYMTGSAVSVDGGAGAT